MVKKKSVFYLIFILTCIIDAPKICASIIADSSFQIVENRELHQDRANYYKGQPEYSYSKSIKYESNFFKRTWETFTERIRRALGLSSQYGVNQFLFYLVICIAIVALIYHLTKTQGTGMWHRKSAGAPLIGDVLTQDDNLTLLEMNKRLTMAIEDKDYRLAVRYHFIKVIAALDRVGLIRWKPELTNNELMKMVKIPETAQNLKELIKIYEHTWYGNYQIKRKSDFENFQLKFDAFINALNSPL